jgi:hypothetical protein
VVVDRGLFHLLPVDRRADFVREVTRLVKPGGVALVIAHQHPAPKDAATFGFSPDELARAFAPAFHFEGSQSFELSGAPAWLVTLRNRPATQT